MWRLLLFLAILMCSLLCGVAATLDLVDKLKGVGFRISTTAPARGILFICFNAWTSR
jgi:hypothetical protein